MPASCVFISVLFDVIKLRHHEAALSRNNSFASVHAGEINKKN